MVHAMKVEGLLVERDRDEVVLTLSRLPKTDNPILRVVRGGAVLSSVCPEQGWCLRIPQNLSEVTVVSSISIRNLRLS